MNLACTHAMDLSPQYLYIMYKTEIQSRIMTRLHMGIHKQPSYAKKDLSPKR